MTAAEGLLFEGLLFKFRGCDAEAWRSCSTMPEALIALAAACGRSTLPSPLRQRCIVVRALVGTGDRRADSACGRAAATAALFGVAALGFVLVARRGESGAGRVTATATLFGVATPGLLDSRRADSTCGRAATTAVKLVGVPALGFALVARRADSGAGRVTATAALFEVAALRFALAAGVTLLELRALAGTGNRRADSTCGRAATTAALFGVAKFGLLDSRLGRAAATAALFTVAALVFLCKGCTFSPLLAATGLLVERSVGVCVVVGRAVGVLGEVGAP